MKEKIEEALKSLENLKKEFKKWCKDKSIPLDERWNLFIKSKLGDHSSSYEDFDCKLGRDYTDDLEDKYLNHDVEDVLEYTDLSNYEEKEIIEYKENVLKSFIKSYTFDW